MPQEEWEFQARDAFIQFLHDREGVAMKPGRAEVVVDSATNRNFDFELLSETGSLPIALEVVRLTPNESSLKANKGWHQICPLIQNGLEELGYNSLFVLVPPLTFKQSSIKEFAKEQANFIHNLIQTVHADNQPTNIQEYSIRTDRPLGGVYVCGSSGGGFIDGHEIAMAQLKPRLEKKNRQLGPVHTSA